MSRSKIPTFNPQSDVPPGTLAWIGVTPRQLAGFLAMVFGMFMAILDIQIVSASLSEIQAGLSASSDEIPWVQTAYLIAEVVMIPLSGFLARALSTRVLFLSAATGFTAASALCATATSIDQMIVYRALQGFIGGGMIPSVFAVAFSLFPPSKRNIVSPIIGLVATLAPTIGPTVGGYLSDAYSWHWLFLVNVVPGILVAVAVYFLVDFDKPDHSLFGRFDFAGLAGMAVMLGSLEYVLEEGPRYDWFDDQTIATFAVFTVLGALLFFWRAATAKEPIVELRAFRDRNFAFGSAFSFTMGIGLYGLTYLYPVYLAQVRGYDALMIGETMFVTGVAMFLTAPISGRLASILDPRVMMLIGFTGFAVGTYLTTNITSDWDFWELFIPQILRGSSLMLCMVPINNLSLGTLPPEQLKNASGLFNLTRNLGGAVGLAMINTILNKRLDLHLERLHESVSWGRAVAEDQLHSMQQSMTQVLPNGDMSALKQLAMLVRTQANVLSFADVFLVLTLLFASAGIFTLMMHKPSAIPAGAGGH
ncbi:EmrB/QacA subfamily drug resistance transporter [Hyphomicrobium denitrificans 1NES1]|uniref:EmrB/QacA subfamily drug resistance transporter n=1 Tax=Hyphomicrobium denitrificans 1NES1 TaxID=670307 RepID=N0BD05_9HYPH|nr:DHA2 family efflux MFS transporter permease subunit [Hyphomicrobium denitrificans]AGK58411.1 EmrB/QacA subfamily drug resistance transporter [Hyphomicrobium denitrificans 1NES1]